MALLEVCVGGVEDAVLATLMGAGRIELNIGLEVGGLTPSASVIKRTLAAVKVPVVVMVRPRPGGFVYSRSEWGSMLDDAAEIMDAGAAGVAFGCLNEQGLIDGERVRAMVELVGERDVVFHRAIDETPDLEEALTILKDLGITRVLTAGGAGDVFTGAVTIAGLIAHNPGIEVMPGGGVTPENIKELVTALACTAIHGSFSQAVEEVGLFGGHRRLVPEAVRAAAIQLE